MEQCYQNPIARNGDFADPFVLRYNGRYYLYCTNPDVRCWSSPDLVNWRLEGPTILPDTFPGLVPFAPEVVYSNGAFYMYTSPSGFGHYVLKSESPTGPFKKITENVGHAIDGSVFIDDDGKWYFYWAGDEGIWGCEMPSPTEFGEPVLTGAFMYGWTEGPLVYKRKGMYYMTYTGNHYLSKGYRINAAWSENPLTGYRDDPYNPVVIHTQDEVVGLGHSSTVVGPDLVSHWMIYHNINEDASRDLDIDRQLWYGQATQILGPTRVSQPVPDCPDYAFPPYKEGIQPIQWDFSKEPWQAQDEFWISRGEDFSAITRQKFSKDFTAEFNLNMWGPQNGALCGILIQSEDGETKYLFAFCEKENTCRIMQVGGNSSKTVISGKLPADYTFNALHNICIELSQNWLDVWIDRRLQLRTEVEPARCWRLGYFAQGSVIGCGYTAVKESTYMEALSRAVIPAECSFAPIFGAQEKPQAEADGSILLQANEQASFTFMIEETGEYRLCITCNSEKALTLSVKGESFSGQTIYLSEGLNTVLLRLSAGTHTLSLRQTAGKCRIFRLELAKNSPFPQNSVDFPPAVLGPFGKRVYGEPSWSDYTVGATLCIDHFNQGGSAGVLLRVTEPSEGGEGADTVLGTYFFRGYSVSVNGKELMIARHRYDRTLLASCPYILEEKEPLGIRVMIRGAEITVYLGNESTPLLSICDPQPLTQGCMGIWVHNSHASFLKCNIHENKKIENK